MSTRPTNIRLPEHLYSKACVASEKMSLPIADVLRQAIALGIQDLALVDYDIDKVIHDAVMKAKESARNEK
jgi:predicted DNA-binding protein